MTPAELRAYRERLGMTQARLAGLLGVRQPHIARWERRGATITPMRAAWLRQEFRRIEAELARR